MSQMAAGTVSRLSQLTFDSTSHLTQQVGTKMAVGTVGTSSQRFGCRHLFLPRARARMRAPHALALSLLACVHARERERERESAHAREKERGSE